MVLAGGAGTRFWPASRRARPKPFVRLMGEQTLLDDTLLRLARVAPAERTCVISAREHAAAIRRSLKRFPGVSLLLEPEARNTASAAAWGAAWVAGRDPEAVMGMFPADHHIPRPEAFARTVAQATRAAADGRRLVLIGIEPTRPDTAYGYLKLGPGRGCVPLERFTEKPSAARARRWVDSGEYLWNAGMIVARARSLLDEVRACAPEVWKPLAGVLEPLAAGRRVSQARVAAAWAGAEPISMDYAVLERSRRVWAVRGRFAWSDLGSWDALGEHLPKEKKNRVRDGDTSVFVDATDNVVWNGSGRPVAVVGLKDVIVVETADAVLVCAKDRAQDVREVVAEWTRRGREDLT